MEPVESYLKSICACWNEWDKRVENLCFLLKQIDLFELQKKGKPGIREIMYSLFSELILIPNQQLICQSIHQTVDETVIVEYSSYFCNYKLNEKEYFIKELLIHPLKERLLSKLPSCSSFSDLCLQYKELKRSWNLFFSKDDGCKEMRDSFQSTNVNCNELRKLWNSFQATDVDRFFSTWIDQWILSQLACIQFSSIDFDCIEMKEMVQFVTKCSTFLSEDKRKEFHSLVESSAMTYFQSAIQQWGRGEITNPLLSLLGRKVCLLLKGLQQLKLVDITRIVSISGIARFVHLTLHHALLDNDDEGIELASNLLHLFSKMDSMYYRLFLLRWNTGVLRKAVEGDLAQRLCCFETYSNIQEILLNPYIINESLITPFVGNYGYILPLDTIQTYLPLRRVSGMKEHRIYSVHTQLGSCCLELDGHCVYGCPAQILVLSLFKEADCLSMNDMISRSPFQPSITRTILESLSCCEKGIFRVSLPKLTRDLRLPSLLSMEFNESMDETKSSFLFDSEERISAWIMKSIKAKQHMSETAIINFVQKQNSYFSREEIRNCIEDLIHREYLIRSEKNSELLQYNI